MQNGFEFITSKPAGSSDSINSYLRLMINILKIYNTQEQNQQMNLEPIDCIWRVYCEELNRIAPVDDMAGTVARINR